MSYSSDIVDAIIEGKVTDRDSLQALKAELCEKYSLDEMPGNPEILSDIAPEHRSVVEPILRIKPVRSLSGVAVVAVMTSPEACPHGKCIYCPGGPDLGTAQSYTGHEPAARRASANSFDPYLQVRSRLEQLSQTGHPIDKVDLIIMGGTFPARDRRYQERFILRCYDAMNGTDSRNIEEAHRLNQDSRSRCIGMTIETRPDQFSDDQIDFLMHMGMTRVELGVQTVYEECISRLKRGHSVEDSITATRRAKRSGLKVCHHLMPGLPGSDFKSDIEMFRTIFEDARFRPDMLKVYPTLVLEGTELHALWKKGEYEPPDTDYIVDLMCEVKKFVPEWIRIQRIQRDIPVPLIAAGARKSNARQLIAERLREQDSSCRCIRCREAGHIRGVDPDESGEFKEIVYSASDGIEHFLEIVHPSSDALIAFARLRLDEQQEDIVSSLRELRVLGQHVSINMRLPEAFQHRGLGARLLEVCEARSIENGARKLRVTSGVGARGYYKRFGYNSSRPYVSKTLPSKR